MSEKDFPPCPICRSESWTMVHSGPVRDGVFGTSKEAEVRRCANCGVDRLAETACLNHSAYESTEYRSHIAQDHDAAKHFSTHDELARFTIETIESVWSGSLRGLTIADVGCGAGAILDHLSGLVDTILAIDPAVAWAESLQQRGYLWFPDATTASGQWAGQVDLVLSIQVIEHVDNPCQFLRDIGSLLSPEGVAIISTPNRRDILMDLLPESFPNFFYRVQHRWAFDDVSLARCAHEAGLDVSETLHIHRYGLANTMYWLKSGEPRGRTPFSPLNSTIDHHWRAWLESTGSADNLYMIVTRQDGEDFDDRRP